MILGYLFLQVFWFLMDNRSFKKKVKFYVLLQGNVCSKIISFGLVVFVFVKFINPSWMFSLQFDSKFLDILFPTVGMLLYSAGLFLCVWARIAIRRSWTPAEDKSVEHKKELITRGPFSFTRNPIYLGLLMIYSGFFIAMKSYLIIVVPFIACFFYKKSLEEERTLEKNFGSDYLKYKLKVHRFV